MPASDKDVQYWKDRFARERAEQEAAEESAIDAMREMRLEFDKKMQRLQKENQQLREQPVVREERNGGGFMAFAVGCAIGLLIGG